MTWDGILKLNSFSLTDFHDFDHCVFRFFVKHHLGKKYQLEQGSVNMTIGSLLDLAVKKMHKAKAYNQPPDFLTDLVNIAESEIREAVIRNGHESFYGSQISFLNQEVIEKTKLIFKNYLEKYKGRINPAISNKTFWEYPIRLEGIQTKIWGGPDVLEMGRDEIPEIVDYKYFEDPKKGKSNLDMDLMPKIYFLLTSSDLAQSGFSKARFRIRSWKDPLDDGIYEEFDLDIVQNLEDFFKDKISRILGVAELTFCEKIFCKACLSINRSEWVDQIVASDWLKGRIT